MRVALLALAIAGAGSEGISRAELENVPSVRSLYSDNATARYDAFLRDLEVLTGTSLRGQRQRSTADQRAADTYGGVEELPVVYDAAADRYWLRRQGAGPLRLSEEAVEALCVVARALRGGTALPGGRELFIRIAEALGEEQRARLEAALQGEVSVSARGPGITLELGLRENMGGLELVMSRLWKAWRERRTVQFSYRANGGVTEHYNDEVLELWLGDHAYANLWSEEANGSFDARLDRIVPETLHFSPKVARGLRRPGVAVCYRLDGAVARGEVTQRLEGQTVEWQPDGSAIVRGQMRSLFWARHLLLRYGSHARALEPPALVAQMRREAERMREMYAEGGDGETAGD